MEKYIDYNQRDKSSLLQYSKLEMLDTKKYINNSNDIFYDTFPSNNKKKVSRLKRDINENLVNIVQYSKLLRDPRFWF